MSSEEDTLEILTPSAVMLPVLTGLRASLSRLGDVKTKSAPRIWDNIDFTAVAKAVARYALVEEGFEGGELPPDDSATDVEVRHRLANELGIMSPDDLTERFAAVMEGGTLTRLYRRTAQAPNVYHLMKDSMALGWSGFNVVRADTAEQLTIRRRRMFTDYFRGDFDWTRLRARELARAAALIELAVRADMLSNDEAFRYRQRIMGEAMVRWASWTAFARALLTARVFEALALGEAEARAVTAREETLLTEFLSNLWQTLPWPRIAG